MTYLTDRQIAQNFISKGDVALRRYDAHWPEKIASTVDVADKALNPLAQVFGNYEEGLRFLNLKESEAAEYGFASRSDVQPSHVNDLWNKLVLTQRQDTQ